MENLNQENQIKEVSAETKGLPTLMESWDNLDAEIARVHELMDIRLFVLMQDFDRWQKDQRIDWLAETDRYDSFSHVYLTTDEQNRKVQLIVNPSTRREDRPFGGQTGRFTIAEQLADQEYPEYVLEDIDWDSTYGRRHTAHDRYEHRVKFPLEENNEDELNYWKGNFEIEIHKLKYREDLGTVFYRFYPGISEKGNHRTLRNTLVAYRMPGDPNVDLDNPDTIHTGYGRTQRIIEEWRGAMGGRVEYMYLPKEIVRKWHEDPAKRVDPIDAGKRTLGLLQKAKLLGRFDTRTGRIIQPTYVPQELEG